MAEENQAQQEPKEPQQVKREPTEPQQVTTKDPKKVEAGKRLAAINHKKREAKKREKAQNGGMSQYYGIGAGFSRAFSTVIAVGVIGCLGYYIYQTKKGGRGVPRSGAKPNTSGEQPSNPQQNNPKPRPQTNKFDMD